MVFIYFIYFFDSDKAVLQKYMMAVLEDEYKKWLQDSREQILGSKDELMKTMSQFRFQDMPRELKNYVADYAKAKSEGSGDQFIVKQATTAYQNALTCKFRLYL